MTWHQATESGHSEPCGRCSRAIQGHQAFALVSSARLVRCAACVQEVFGEQPPVELESVARLPPLPFSSTSDLAHDWKLKQARAD